MSLNITINNKKTESFEVKEIFLKGIFLMKLKGKTFHSEIDLNYDLFVLVQE